MSDFSSQPVLDRDILDELADIMEDEFGELVEAFLEDSPRLMTEIESGLTENDAHRVAEAAHSLKSSSANLGVMRLSAIAKEIETSGRAGDMNGCASLSKDLSNAWAESKQALETIV